MSENYSETKGDLDYSPVLFKKDDVFYFYIQELKLIAKGDSVASAYQNLMEEKEAKINIFREVHGLEALPPNENPFSSIQKPGPKNTVYNTMFKLLKFTVILLIVFFCMQYTAQNITSHAAKIVRAEAKEFRIYIRERFLDPERAKDLQKRLRIVIRNYKPLIKDVMSSLQEENINSGSISGESSQGSESSKNDRGVKPEGK